MKWHYTKDNDYPQPREGKGKEDSFQCFVFRAREYRILTWNCYYDCWDDEEGDDYLCDKEAVEKWISLDEITSELES